ncbi:DNA repair XRCC4 [Olea europaea subsp. europaea]|uniref:DNA repair XRCC4 n=1 Tax=Olea europaea subsp. europaea TaxID=158383 RepID=A0A8S0S6U8_OLEEU|nr:DNA repair XRCC4 [Olea europaea subsp. europaea]
MESPRHTCVKLIISEPDNEFESERIFVKGTWYSTRFVLSITNGLHAWTCHATEEEVKERATQWDQPVSEYIHLAEKYLGFEQPGSVYGFSDAGNGFKRGLDVGKWYKKIANLSMLTWTFEKEGTKLEWRWKCQPSPDSKITTADVLDFLMDANTRLSEEFVRQTQSTNRLKVEAEKCLSQNDNPSNEKTQFEKKIYGKFAGVLSSKKGKLRQLRDRLSKQINAKQLHEEDEVSKERTESFDEETDEGNSGEERRKKDTGYTKDAPTRRPHGRKRK